MICDCTQFVQILVILLPRLVSTMNNVLYRALITMVTYLSMAETESSSYSKIYDGYVFTLPALTVYKTQDEAQRLCKMNESNLLEIKSSYIHNLTALFLNNIGVQFGERPHLITSGIRTDSKWNWVNGQNIKSISIDGQSQGEANSFGYIRFNPSAPSITASMPVANRGYICQGKFNCTNGFWIKDLCHKSYYSSPTVSWFDARNRCLNEGGDLASFDFISDNQGLSILNGSWVNPSTSYWIGIRRQIWMWKTSNLEVKYSNWQNGRPVYAADNRCLCLYKSDLEWKWIECNCSLSFRFVCMTVLPTTTVATTETTTTDTTTLSGFISYTATNSNSLTGNSSTASIQSTYRLGVGIGVGIGGALIIAVIIIVVIIVRKRGCSRKPQVLNPPDVTLHPMESNYVEILKQSGNERSATPDADCNQSTPPPPPVYADLDIFTQPASPSMEQDTIFLISAKTATLAPPTARKETVHVTLGGQVYAEIRRT